MHTRSCHWASGLRCRGAAASISLRHGVLHQPLQLEQETSRASTAKPAPGAKEGWRELFHPFSAPLCKVTVHGQVIFITSLQISWYLIGVAGFTFKRIDMLQDCQLWSQSLTKISHFTLLTNTPISQWHCFLSLLFNSQIDFHSLLPFL